ncbi:MAG: porin [Gammaproteobacteria bacterium]|nr:porin [Gammaproteobacteria bacterium]
MNKKILAVATAALLTGAIGVQAAPTVYGRIDLSIDAIDSAANGTDDINMNSNTSMIGMKGSEDLGDGLKAIYKIEIQIDASERDKNQIDRDQWVGLKGNFGQVRMGTISSSYKSHGAAIDPLYRTSAQGRSWGLQSKLHSGAGEVGGRMNKHIRFDSNNYNGVKVTADYSFDASDSDGTQGNDTFGVGASYKNGPVMVFTDYLSSNDGGDDSVWKIGGKFNAMEGLTFYGQYESDGGLISNSKEACVNVQSGACTSSAVAAATPYIADGVGPAVAAQGAITKASANDVSGADVWYLGASMALGNTTVVFNLGQGDDNDHNQNVGYKSWTLAAAHKLSKRTMVYGGFVQQDFDATGETDVVTFGMRHNF